MKPTPQYPEILNCEIITAQDLIRELLKLEPDTIVTNSMRPVKLAYSPCMSWIEDRRHQLILSTSSMYTPNYVGYSKYLQIDYSSPVDLNSNLGKQYLKKIITP